MGCLSSLFIVVTVFFGVQDSFDKVRYCTRCQAYKPPRSHHCKFVLLCTCQIVVSWFGCVLKTKKTETVSGAHFASTITVHGSAPALAITTTNALFSFCSTPKSRSGSRVSCTLSASSKVSQFAFQSLFLFCPFQCFVTSSLFVIHSQVQETFLQSSCSKFSSLHSSRHSPLP